MPEPSLQGHVSTPSRAERAGGSLRHTQSWGEDGHKRRQTHEHFCYLAIRPNPVISDWAVTALPVTWIFFK